MKYLLSGVCLLLIGFIAGGHYRPFEGHVPVGNDTLHRSVEITDNTIACNTPGKTDVTDSVPTGAACAELEKKVNDLQQALSRLESGTSSSPGTITAEPGYTGPPVSLVSSSLQDTLVQAGISPDTAERIFQRIGEKRMALVTLRNKATREGWIDSPGYLEMRAMLADPEQKLRSEFGDKTYDRYLHAVGQSNRVRVKDIYPGSQAAATDLRRGDVITRYASRNIYQMGDLRQVTTDGDASESVLVEIQREGHTEFINIPRGPIGIEMEAAHQPPE